MHDKDTEVRDADIDIDIEILDDDAPLLDHPTT